MRWQIIFFLNTLIDWLKHLNEVRRDFSDLSIERKTIWCEMPGDYFILLCVVVLIYTAVQLQHDCRLEAVCIFFHNGRGQSSNSHQPGTQFIKATDWGGSFVVFQLVNSCHHQHCKQGKEVGSGRPWSWWVHVLWLLLLMSSPPALSPASTLRITLFT